MSGEKITAEYLEQIFRENYSRYYYYALSVVDESEVAKDIIGEVFLAVWKNRVNIDEQKLNSYIFTSIRNKCLNERSKNLTFVQVEGSKVRLSADTAEETDPWGLPEPRDENKYVIVRGSDYRKPYKVSIIDSNMLTAFMKTDTDEYGGRLWLKTIGFRVILPRK
jgi:DNA-directed RNA polymerase specialized sigma24 family protein